MKKYIAFLRGINVGNIRIKMTDLKLALEQLGLGQVKTYLQTGNVVFEADQTLQDLKPLIEKKLSFTFDYEAFVLLYEFDALVGIIVQYPMERVESHHAYVLFIESEVIFEELKALAQGLTEEEQIAFGKGVFYWKVAKGETTETAFAKIIAKAKYKSTTTMRNINTLEKMIAD